MSSLTFDDRGFRTETSRVSWHDLVAVGIRTTAGGPLSEDVFWQFMLRDGLIELPGSMLTDLDPMAKRLPGLDFAKVIKAMGSCNERIFRVWHHEESHYRPDASALRVRFARLVARLGARTDSDDTFTRIYAAWSSELRRYHDVEHLTDCLREVDRLPVSPTRHLVELALWYHDAVYEAGATDCEHRSAGWLATDAARLGLPESLARITAALVEATAHGAGRIPSDEAAVVADIDLAILGRDPLRFMDFEYSVEEEFGAVPTIAFRRGRGRFLAGLLENPIYRTTSFRDRFETTARANIAALIHSRRYAAYR
jgi:predicted metal-dependent HD superfamily phosphohydrolase